MISEKNHDSAPRIMFFYIFGGILWYYLFYKSKYIPRAISLYGLMAVFVALVGMMFEIFGYTVPMFVYLPLLPFELAIGFWLLIKGINVQQTKEFLIK